MAASDRAAQNAMERWKTEQENELSLMKMGFSPATPQQLNEQKYLASSNMGGAKGLIKPSLEFGGKTYISNPELMMSQIMPYLALAGKVGGNSGIGLTGFNVGASGKPSLTFGETPESKQKREVETASEKKSSEIEKEMQSIDSMVESIYKTANELIPAVESPAEAEKLGIKRGLGSASILGMRPQRLIGLSDENTIAYNEIMKAEATPIIRSMGEKGMLTNQDIERALGLFPKNSDSTKLRKTRRDKLAEFLKSKIKVYYSKLNGSPVGQGQYKEGDTITKNGITYTYNKDGVWEY
jgi:hypothetical protein